ncbi:MAG: twin-arginine translocase subunit TatC [Ignavibacteria bacterium]|nr:twin-arginine translocase subunit TatC [Ignavibacteria bacterium]
MIFKKKAKQSSSDSDMTFLEHVDELRKRIIYSLIGVIVGCIIVGLKIDFIINELLLGPATRIGLKLQNLQPFGQPFLYFKVLLVGGVIISLPFILYQIWKFVAPGLYPNEKKWVRLVTFFTTFCFLLGVLFAYFVLVPLMLNFSAYFGTSAIENRFDINYYFGFVTMMILSSGLIFEMPMVSFVLSKFGILTSKFMRKYRRHSIVAILILAAVLTPTPDPVNQLIFAGPLFILYEISIVIAKIFEVRNVESQQNEKSSLAK